MSHKTQAVREFILDKSGQSRTVNDTDDLIESGLIDSLRFLDFIMLIEELSGRKIAIDDLDVAQFRTLKSIEKAFFAG